MKKKLAVRHTTYHIPYTSRGVSLLEILVVITIFAVLGVLVTRSVLLTLRGARRSEATLRIRENVNYAQSVIERQLRNANSVSPCPNPDPTILNYLDENGNPSTFSCVGLNTQDTFIASGSARLTNPSVKFIDCSISCSAPIPNVPSSVTFSIQAQDASASGIENPTLTSSTTIQLRNY